MVRSPTSIDNEKSMSSVSGLGFRATVRVYGLELRFMCMVRVRVYS